MEGQGDVMAVYNKQTFAKPALLAFSTALNTQNNSGSKGVEKFDFTGASSG